MPAGLHHVAFACRDLEETHRFYGEYLELPLIRTEVQPIPDGGALKHTFYDLGDGSCVAFFHLPGFEAAKTAISTDLDLPVWVNHLAIRVDEDQQTHLRGRLEDAGVPLLMDLDHDWCHSYYYVDPNGIMVELCRDTTGFDPDEDEALRLMRQS